METPNANESPKLPPWLGWGLWLLPVLLLALYPLTDPFRHVVASQSLSTSGLSAAQRSNIRLAAQALEGRVLRPGEAFSFNRAVGPRTRRRGYQSAPSYLGGESPQTLGGGICLLSSAVYQAALKGNLTITRRVPHLRTIRTVPPGLDATVWYGGADLSFKNNTGAPVLLQTRWTPSDLRVELKGREPKAPVTLRRLTSRKADNRIQVEVYRQVDGRETLVSRDLYGLSAGKRLAENEPGRRNDHRREN